MEFQQQRKYDDMGTFINGGNTFASDNTLGVVSITNPSNAQLSDDTYATSVLLITQVSNYLKVTNFLFGVPSDATITGVTLSVEKSGNTLNATVDSSVRLVKGGVISGNDKASASLWSTSDAVATYGSSTDLWGLTLTPADVNSSSFGFVINASATLAGTAQIDYVSLQIDYIGSNKPVGTVPRVQVGNGVSRNDLAT